MSFQGDVAGIGLGELLQGLSRGGRDGVLSLHGDKVSAALGLRRGLLYLLPAPDESDDLWRQRTSRAYADDLNPDIESRRRVQIARAGRLEAIFQMLDAPNLHFRFEPGPLPLPVSATARLPQPGEPEPEAVAFGAGLTVEYVLLEHARISDESKSGPASTLSRFDVPRALDASQHRVEVRDFLEECDGNSTLEEISDRMGWPLSQCRATVGSHLAAGTLRMAKPRELLAVAQRELELGRVSRAATRLSGWILTTPPGPCSVADANLLLAEWERGRLQHILHAIEPKVARTLLRKLDRVHRSERASLARWTALAAAHRADEVCMLHEIALRLVVTTDPDTRTFHDLLRLARAFRERGADLRTRTLLRLAASHLPEKPQVRIELGKRMIETGLVQEGTRWLLEAAHELLEQDEPERAIASIRHVLRADPEHADASQLLIHARALQAKKKRRRWNLLIGLSCGLVLSLAAAVKFHSYRHVERQLQEIQGLMGHPSQALTMLDQSFGNDPPDRVVELRGRVLDLVREEEKTELEEWRRGYVEVEDACRYGDPLLGLRRTLELPPQPGSTDGTNSTRQDLLGVLANRLGERSEDLDLPVDAMIESLHQEERLADLLQEILSLIDLETADPEVKSFHFRVDELLTEIRTRSEKRAVAREAMLAKNEQKQQDILLATARAHAQAGDLERSLVSYDRLIESDETLATLPVLQEEIHKVREHWNAVKLALELAEKGDHAGAESALLGVCPRPIEHLLPFRVDSSPQGAEVLLSDGSRRITPFLAKSGVGERLELAVKRTGFEDRKLVLDRPANLVIHLFRYPERSFVDEHRIEAAPVPTGDDHVIADRFGHLRRLGAGNESRWEVSLKTLGGIARTPIFLPGKPGFLFVISEDGQAWLVDSATGSAEGPREIGSPPVQGPVLTRAGVSVAFADGRVGVWSDRLEPTFYPLESMVTENRALSDGEHTAASVVILRNELGGPTGLVSPWNRWKVTVEDDHYAVTAPDGTGFSARREGDWSYVAWESPKAFVPEGRVWVSDKGGLRAYLCSSETAVTLQGR
jgi:tetratricopeptide (TPR) repeat protein